MKIVGKVRAEKLRGGWVRLILKSNLGTIYEMDLDPDAAWKFLLELESALG